jgi:hypothetical protein
MAEDLMTDPELDRCLLVGAEEADWLLCDAYHKWRLLRSAPPIEPFRIPPRGTILSEGAGEISFLNKCIREEIFDTNQNWLRNWKRSAVSCGMRISSTFGWRAQMERLWTQQKNRSLQSIFPERRLSLRKGPWAKASPRDLCGN